MKKIAIAIILLISLSASSGSLQASEWHYGFELAYFKLNTESVDDPDNMGLLLGYSWDIDYGSVAIEGELTSTFEDGLAGSKNTSVDTAGIYGIYRTRNMNQKDMGPYFKLKAGTAYTDLTIANANKTNTKLSGGLGFGINMISVAFELDYTRINDDLDMFNLLVLF